MSEKTVKANVEVLQNVAIIHLAKSIRAMGHIRLTPQDFEEFDKMDNGGGFAFAMDGEDILILYNTGEVN